MKALITGVNSEVNKVLFKKLIADSFDVVAHYHTDNDLTKELVEAHPEVTFIQANFETQDGFETFLKQATEQGKYDVIVSGAVYYAEASDWTTQLDWSEWQKTFAINTTSAGMLMAHADKLVNDGGVIVNISSTYGQTYMGDTQFTMYGASKASLDLLTENYAKRWHKNQIRVVGIAPGWVKSAWNKGMSEQDIADMLSPEHLVAKLIEPDEIASLMSQLIVNKGINATTVVIDGGLSSPIV